MELRQIWYYLGQGSIYYPQLAKAMGGVTVAILYQTLWQWATQKGTVQCSLTQLSQATGLNEQEQTMAREQLTARSLLSYHLVSNNPTIYSFQLHFEQLETLLSGETPSSPPVTATQQQSQSDPYFPPRRQPISVSVTPDYRFSGPWESQEQLESFQQALLEYAKQQGHPNPSAWVFKIIDSISKGIKSPFWDEFIAGKPLGESQKVQQEWEIEPGVPYPAFESERVQYYLHKGEPLETAVAKARAELRDPVKAKDLWDGFLRKCDRLADEALEAKKTGVQEPYLPPSFQQQRSVSKESVMEKLSQVQSDKSLLEQESPPEKTLSETKEEPNSSSDIPSLEHLQTLYDSPMTKSWVEQQIAQHPEWGYQIVDGKVVDQYPF